MGHFNVRLNLIAALWTAMAQPSFSQEPSNTSASYNLLLLSCHAVAFDRSEELELTFKVDLKNRLINGIAGVVTDQSISFKEDSQNITEISRITGSMRIISPYGILYSGMCKKIEKLMF